MHWYKKISAVYRDGAPTAQFQKTDITVSAVFSMDTVQTAPTGSRQAVAQVERAKNKKKGLRSLLHRHITLQYVNRVNEASRKVMLSRRRNYMVKEGHDGKKSFAQMVSCSFTGLLCNMHFVLN